MNKHMSSNKTNFIESASKDVLGFLGGFRNLVAHLKFLRTRKLQILEP